MSRVLILQQDLPHLDSRIATGGGLRAHALGQGLAAIGHEVFYSVPYEIFNTCTEEEIELYGLLWHSSGNIRYAIERSSPDVIILQWLGSYECIRGSGDIPVVIDLVAPRLLELWHRGHPLESEVRAKVDALSLGDFFICSNQRLWYYFLPWLTLAGESNAGRFLDVVPVSAPVRKNVKKRIDEIMFVWGGVRWPWNNPLPFLNIVSDEIKNRGKGRLLVLSGKFPYKYGSDTRFSEWERGLKLHSGVELMPLLSYQEMLGVYMSANVAIDICEDLPERRLASPFRTKDYLSCGLPLITAGFMDIAPHVREYDAGWVVDGADRAAFRLLVRTLIRSPELTDAPGARARQLLSDRFTFEEAVGPLDRFCQNPSKRRKGRSLFDVSISMGCIERLRENSCDSEALRILEYEEGIGEVESLHYNKGLILMKAGKPESARREFLKEEELFPSGVRARLRIKRIELHEGRAPAALVPEIEDLLEKHPGEENIRFELALLYYLSGKGEKAAALFEEETSLFKGEVFKSYSMGSELKKRGMYARSLYYFKKVVSCGPSTPDFSGGSYFHMGEIHLERGETERAIPCFTRCIEILPGHRRAGEYMVELAKGGL